MLFILERFLYRLSHSRHRERLVLKGGMLLAVYEERRPTRDVDLLARAASNDIDTLARLVQDVLAVQVDDGVDFDPDRLTAQVIREAELHSGVRMWYQPVSTALSNPSASTSTLAATRQREWERFTDRSGLVASVPASYEDTIAAVADFADPILTGALTSESWDPDQRRWRVTTDQG